jgi:hypothetical protein
MILDTAQWVIRRYISLHRWLNLQHLLKLHGCKNHPAVRFRFQKKGVSSIYFIITDTEVTIQTSAGLIGG